MVKSLLCMMLSVLTTGGLTAADLKSAVKDLAWMTGNWIEKKDRGDTEENWTTPKGGVMLGVNRTVPAKGRTAYEFLRIADTDAGVVYFASPMGRAATEFALKSSEKEKAVFENLKNDFPQTITYWKADGKLHAKIEATKDGKTRSMAWTWDAAK